MPHKKTQAPRFPPGFLDGITPDDHLYVQAKPVRKARWLSFDVMHQENDGGDYVQFVDNATGERFRVSGLEWVALGATKPDMGRGIALQGLTTKQACEAVRNIAARVK